MKTLFATASKSRKAFPAFAFTLIELLIVISIIAILAGLILSVTGSVNKTKIRSKARTEMATMVMAIEDYKSKMGHYPPDNPSRPEINPLYFELLGTKITNSTFTTLDGSAGIATAQLPLVFGNIPGGGPAVSGFINCSGKGGGDEAATARRFLPEVKPGNVASSARVPTAKFLVCSIPSPVNDSTMNPPDANRWHYVSSNPTNNPNGFDLWVDVKVGNRTNRICNWSKEALIVSY